VRPAQRTGIEAVGTEAVLAQMSGAVVAQVKPLRVAGMGASQRPRQRIGSGRGRHRGLHPKRQRDEVLTLGMQNAILMA
jgi:hypothetical protein